MRFTFFLPLIIATLAGCATSPWPRHAHYHRVRVTNYRGELIADWIAIGPVVRTGENSYRLRAVERFSGPPGMEDVHYPDGRKTEAVGPNIHISPCGEPLWLYELYGR